VIRRLATLLLLVLASLGILYFLANRTTFIYSIRGMQGFVPPLGTLLDPAKGLWYTARAADRSPSTVLAGVKGEVTIVRDERGVPHIYAHDDADAVVGLGFVMAQDRLFQLDFIPRAAAGKLSEVFGPSLLTTDRHLRSTGMDRAAKAQLARIQSENGISNDVLRWFADGVNAYLDGLDPEDLPLEFRLLDYKPERYGPIQSIRMMMYMTYDLSFHTDDPSYGRAVTMMDPSEYGRLFPRFSQLYLPIIPGSDRSEAVSPDPGVPGAALSGAPYVDPLFPGFEPGKGSNNWAVNGQKSATGGAILAGDMHLRLTLPAIWYEVHMVTDSFNTYGVTLPGAPGPVEAFNGRLGWTFTNSGADQIDHYRLVLDESRTSYRFEDEWTPFELVMDTVRVRGADAVIDTLRYTYFGPVMNWGEEPYAIQWTAHKPSRTIEALWDMNHATDAKSFQQAIGKWDAPMQNILYADAEGNIAMRVAGYLPVRNGVSGAGLRDGTSKKDDWAGRVPFEDLPYVQNPAQGFLTSANQQPVGKGYRYYLGHDWSTGYRSMRINQLLRARDHHTVDDLKSYQSDVHVVQRDLFVPLLDTLHRLSPDAAHLRDLLSSWDGEAGIERPEPLVFDHFLNALENLAWDEFDVESVRRPKQQQLYMLLTEDPKSRWLDIRDTQLLVETGADLLRSALESTVDTLRAKYGWGEENWTWGKHHVLAISHLTRSDALASLGHEDVPYPGFDKTLSPARRRRSFHSASWRMVVDFSGSEPRGFGVFPGGQSGNPFSRHYDDFVPTYLQFGYYRLLRPSRPDDILSGRRTTTVLLPTDASS